uniref:Uncharacterized protein n=1 Tax=Ciona savignyi TaxID=51511 RepID=H2YR91_CIOSA
MPPPSPVVSYPGNSLTYPPTTGPLEVIQPVHIEPVIVTSQMHGPPPTRPQNVVVDIENPLNSRNRSPEAKGLRHGGDSGIDLTNYEQNRDRLSSDPSEYDIKRRHSKQVLTQDTPSEPTSSPYMEWYRRQYLKPTCCHLFIKHVICAINLVFLIIGLGLIGLGLWGFIDLMTSGNPGSAEVFLFDPILIVLVTGVVISFITAIAIIGIMKDSVCLIKTYISLLVVLCIILVAGGITFWVLRPKVTAFATSSLANLIAAYNTTSRKAASFTINQLQTQLACCGASGHEDWILNRAYSCSDPTTCSLPPSCCETNQVACTGRPGARPGCIAALTSWIKNNTVLLIGIWLGVIVVFIVFQFVAVHFHVSFCLFQALQLKIAAYEADLSVDDVTTTSSSSSASSSESEERERRRRRRKRRKKRRTNHKRRNYHVNPAYS